jgi:conserved hypothetical protein, DprA/Smf-related, family 1
MRVSVIGGSSVDSATAATAEALGDVLASRGHTVICGGLSGVMTAVCRGAKSEGGHTIGILPGDDPGAANEFVDTPIATDLNHARNPLVVMNGDAVIAIDGSSGTLSELGHALTLDKPVAGLDTHHIDGIDGIEHVETPVAAVEYVEASG